MKLKCEDHGRRVMVLPSSTVLHRSDGSKCESNNVSMGVIDPSKNLLRDIFGNSESIDLTRI